jgi:mannose-6-phosphate isomerase-like protein (cupin superfamily)
MREFRGEADMSHQPQPTPPFAPAAAFARNGETAPAYWMLILWLVLVDGRDIGGSSSVMEQLMPAGSGPRLLHVHPTDEWFYVVEGEMTAEVGGQTIVGSAGHSLWIPRGTAHRFTVTTPICRALNGYTPAGFEQVVIGLAEPAEKRELPPLVQGPPDASLVAKLFNNYWSADANDRWALSRMRIQWV